MPFTLFITRWGILLSLAPKPYLKIKKKSRQAKSKVDKVALNKLLAKDQACYVLIMCGVPGEDGKMHVEMSYEGDPVLAAYLVESAQQFIDVEEG